MINEVVILGSTGSVGSSTLSSIYKNKKFKVKLLTTNKNVKKLLNQAIEYNVKNVIIENETKYLKYRKLFKKKKINLYLGHNNINIILKKRVNFCINSISGIYGLEPTLAIIPFTKKILIANKESIICGWHLISKKLKFYNTEFIPIDSEHFSIRELIKDENKNYLDKIILTASGGPFLYKSKKKLLNIKPKFALRHPNWKMGKKISIDSSTMMNKIFEYLEAKKIFKLKRNNIKILIHPDSYIHAIVYFKNGLIKFLAHAPKMIIPISRALDTGIKKNLKPSINLKKLNNLNFSYPKLKQFPLLSIINIIPKNDSFFEIILIALNDKLVNKYLEGKINYISISKNLLFFIKCSYLKKFFKFKPKNVNEIKKMINITDNYLEKNIRYYEK